MNQLNSLLIRYLQTSNTTATNITTNVTDTSVTKPALTMGQVAATTLKIYGVIFLILFLIYLFFRPIYKAAYNARGFHETFGRFSWIVKIFTFDDDFLIEHCGLDSVSFLRLLRFGFKVSLVGMFNALYLIPVNATACRNHNDACYLVKDYILQSGLGHVEAGSNSLFATTVAAYIFFGSAMYFIYTEFSWYTEKRHAFLKKREPENYTVYISNIPPAYCSSLKLYEYFCKIFSSGNVLETQIALDIPQLEKLSIEREKLVDKLEHAINVRSSKKVTPKHRSPPLIGRKVDSIETFTTQLAEMNEDIARRIDTIQAKAIWPNQEVDSKIIPGKGNADEDALMNESMPLVSSKHSSLQEDISNDIEKDNGKSTASGHIDSIVEPQADAKECDTLQPQVSGSQKNFMKNSISTLKTAASSFSDIFKSSDGKVRTAGFVTFKTLLAAAKCVQMIHHHTPFVFTVSDAPNPDDVYWKNVGLTNKKIQMGNLLSLSLTLFLCIIWTIPVSFISSLSQASELQKRLPFLADWIREAPWLPLLLAQLQPLLLVLLNSVVLKGLLRLFCRLEGHISSTKLNVSLFSKLSTFLIIQIFFIQAISGSIFREVDAIVKSPLRIINLLSSSIPAQVIAFMQYVMVQTFLSMGLEIIRLVPIILGFIRKKLGPSLTPKERNKIWLGLRPIENYEVLKELGLPPVLYRLELADVLSNLILFFMITFAYACISPAMSFLMCFIFGLLETCYRNQLIYVYSPENDSGGQLWPNAVKVLIACLIIAEITLFGIMGLKKGIIAAPLCLPLLITTVLFMQYLKQQHYIVPNRLPSIDCSLEDTRNVDGNYDFLQNMYLQPALKTKTLEPENLKETTKDTV